MTIGWSRKTAPTVEPLDAIQGRDQSRVSVSSSDRLIEGYVAAARAWVEEYTGRSLLTQTWQLSVSEFPMRLWLPRSVPLQSVTFVKYYDGNNVLQTLSSTVYSLPAFQEPALLTLGVNQTWPAIALRHDAVQVEYVTGAANIVDVPQPLVQAIAMLAAHFYEHREAAMSGDVPKEIEFSVKALCNPFRVYWLEPSCESW